MWSTEYSTETGLAAAAIWAALSDLHHGGGPGRQQ